MININNLRNYTVNEPDKWNLFGSAADLAKLPPTHQEQILLLDADASKFVWEYASAAHLLTGGGWAPFQKGNFKEVDEFDTFWQTPESEQLLKKWLYNRSIPFKTWVMLLQDGGANQVVLTTWKMIVKYSPLLFIMNDVMVFDQTLNWCLFYYHEDKLFFGRDNIYDNTEDLKELEALNERKQKYPQFKHPYL